MVAEHDGDGYIHWAFVGYGDTIEGSRTGDGHCNLCMPDGDRNFEYTPDQLVTGDGP